MTKAPHVSSLALKRFFKNVRKFSGDLEYVTLLNWVSSVNHEACLVGSESIQFHSSSSVAVVLSPSSAWSVEQTSESHDTFLEQSSSPSIAILLFPTSAWSPALPSESDDFFMGLIEKPAV